MKEQEQWKQAALEEAGVLPSVHPTAFGAAAWATELKAEKILPSQVDNSSQWAENKVTWHGARG